MTSVVVILTMVVGAAILGTVDTQNDPVANLEISASDSSIEIRHQGGTSLSSSQIDVVLQSTTTSRQDLSTFRVRSGNGNGLFEPGEVVVGTHNTSGSVRVLIVHRPSNAVVTNDVIEIPVSGGGPLVWEVSGDWDAATSEVGVVHADFGDHDADRIELGYSATHSSLVGYWPLDGESGPVRDASGEGNDGSIDGDPIRTANGLWNTSAWSFDGSDDSITVPDDQTLDMNRTNEVTVSMWIKQSSSQSGWIGLLQHSDTAYNLQLSDGDPAFTIYDDTWHTAYFGSSITNGQWYHLVGTFDGNDIRLYVNGTLAGTATAEYVNPGGGSPVGIAYNNDTGNRHFDGRIDAIRVYDRALTTSEVRTLWTNRDAGSLTTALKQFRQAVDPTTLTLSDVNSARPLGTNVTLFVESDPEGDGSFNQSDPITLDGGRTYDVTGLSEESRRYRLRIELKSTVLTEGPRFGGATLRSN